MRPLRPLDPTRTRPVRLRVGGGGSGGALAWVALGALALALRLSVELLAIFIAKSSLRIAAACVATWYASSIAARPESSVRT